MQCSPDDAQSVVSKLEVYGLLMREAASEGGIRGRYKMHPEVQRTAVREIGANEELALIRDDSEQRFVAHMFTLLARLSTNYCYRHFLSALDQARLHAADIDCALGLLRSRLLARMPPSAAEGGVPSLPEATPSSRAGTSSNAAAAAAPPPSLLAEDSALMVMLEATLCLDTMDLDFLLWALGGRTGSGSITETWGLLAYAARQHRLSSAAITSCADDTTAAAELAAKWMAIEANALSLHSVSLTAQSKSAEGRLVRKRLAEIHARECVELRVRCFGTGAPATFAARMNLAMILKDAKEDAAAQKDAEQLFRDVRAGFERLECGGPGGHKHLIALRRLAVYLLFVKEQADEAKPLFDKALVGSKLLLGVEHPFTLSSMNDAGLCLRNMGRDKARMEAHPRECAELLKQAAELFQEALSGRKRVLDSEHPLTLSSISNLGTTREAQGNLAEALKLYRKAYLGRDEIMGPGHFTTRKALEKLRWCEEKMGKLQVVRDVVLG